MVRLIVNGVVHEIEVEDDTPLLWVLRDHLGLKGTKFSCGAAMCGACTVHVDGEIVRSCIYPVELVGNAPVRTIEGLATGDTLHPVQQAWTDVSVPQCGYCQSGFIMATVKLLETNPDPSDTEIAEALSNICRCGTYERVVKAVHKAVENMRDQ